VQGGPEQNERPAALTYADLGASTLQQLVAEARDGIGVLDEQLRFVYVNPAGCEILGRRIEDLVGTSSLLVAPPGATAGSGDVRGELVDRQAGRQTAMIVRPDGREREIEYTAHALDVQGRQLVAGIFRDVTDIRRAERWATAFTRITSGLAGVGDRERIVEELSRGVVEATGMRACAVVLVDVSSGRLHVAGAHGLPHDYGRRFEAAVADGLDLPAVQAFHGGDVVDVRSAAADPVLAADPTWAAAPPWDTLVSAPMRVGGRPVGVLKGFLPAALRPDDDLLTFLDAIGDQAAVAVENMRLFGEATEASRRQEVLVQAGLTLALELSLPTVLTKIVQFACAVAGATYGALGVLAPDGHLEDFVTYGVTDEQRRAIGALPVGRGLLGELIREARPVRLRDLQDHPSSQGFPPEHPPMTSFLGVPVSVRGRVYGNLYLTEKRGALEFSEADERAVVTLAAQAGVAIENARLFSEAQERLALEERTRLARELHDSVSQALFAMTLETGAAQRVLHGSDAAPEGLRERLQRLRELTEGALAEMRALIFALRPDAIREEGLLAAIRKQAEGIAAREDLVVAVDAPDERLPLAPDMEEQLYRLVQEALSNVARHAEASHVWVRVLLTGTGELVVEVEDDGIGFDPAVPRPGHLGLRSMAQRAEALHGRVEVLGRPGGGTLVCAAVPLARRGGS
jgi:PAS domain S-box-containing protein